MGPQFVRVSATIQRIRLTPSVLKPKVGVTRLNEIRGGPSALLNWLEIQLGLVGPEPPKSSRVTELASALDGVTGTVFSESLATDRWATSSELLARRDQLRMAGWNGDDNDLLPQLLRDIARATAAKPLLFADPATRLQRVLQALADGQHLPPHRCVLEDPITSWPPVWRSVLKRLALEDAPHVLPAGLPGSALQAAQDMMLTCKPGRIAQDASLRFVTTRSQAAACEFVAATLAKDPGSLPETVVHCEDDALALRLDACLKRLGMPTMGSVAVSRAHPALQVLPLSLSLCWDPVDPQLLVDFLALPVSPLPPRAATALVESLVEQPGLGSAAWDAAIAELRSGESDADGKLRTRIDAWLNCERTPRNEPISTAVIRSRCGLVAQWAAGRASRLLEDGRTESIQLAEALRVAAGQASSLGELVEIQGKTITEPQLGRLVEEVTSIGVDVAPFMEAFNGPLHVRSLAEIDAPYRRLIWLGLGSADAKGCTWPVADLESINSAGIDLDDGSRELGALRSAEQRGFSMIREALLAVLLPQDSTQRWHPVWLAIRTALDERETPAALEDLFAAGHEDAILPFAFDSATQRIIPPPPRRLLWRVPAGLLQDRETVSASDLQDRLGCPLKWVFEYRARLWPSPIAVLPDEFQMKGRFCHTVLERLFGDGGELPGIEEAADRAGRIFDERLPLDAAPLAQPDKILERRKLRTEMVNATRSLVKALSSGHYRIAGVEVEATGDAFGKPLKGWIDCLAVRDDGQEAVIDFKYAARDKHRELIAEGRAVQLATYAHGRSQGVGVYPAVAYLVIADAQIYTPSGSPLSGECNLRVVDGPPIQEVWRAFSGAISGADKWLTGGHPVPALPLQPPEEWPWGADLVLDADRGVDQMQEPCRYCDYGRLCGRAELQ